MRTSLPITAGLLLLGLAGSALAAEVPHRPNILFILADDMGFSDAGCYGGEIETPNLDRLAAGGLRFTQFYNTARCWPSRACILTGYYAQAVRRDNLPGIASGGQGVRPKWAQLLPVYLKPLGYRSYHSGKWHVDGKPLQDGFDHSYDLEDHDRNFYPKSHFEDDVKLPPVEPGSGYYTTTFMADHAIKCLKEHAEKYADRPFFEYLAFTVPHFPIQAPAEDVAKYLGHYRAGWDALRRQRHARMKELGIVTCDLSARTPGVPAWDTLSDAEKDAWDARMAVHAAMVHRMDREIGRVIDQVKAMGALENTLIIFLSDNGASAERVLRGDGHDPTAPPGSARTFLCIEPGWANLCNSPLRRSKIYVHEGGISTPLILHWPAVIKDHGQLRHNPGHLIDFVPTLLELAGGKTGREGDSPIFVERKLGQSPEAVPPLPGKSLLPVLTKDNTVPRDYLWWFHSGNRAIRMGDWKIVTDGAGPWELYDLAKDRCEMHDLAQQLPDKARELQQAWTKHLEEFRVLATSDGKGLAPEKPAAKKPAAKRKPKP
jgi:arylsulfatase A-like enzyme